MQISFFAVLANRRKKDVESLLMTVAEATRHAPTFTGIGCDTISKAGYADVHNYNGERTICWEAPVCYLVYLGQRPALGLGVEFRGKALCIRQMQGAPNITLPPVLHAWPQLLVEACMRFAKEKNLREVRVYSADQLMNYRCPMFEKEMSRDERRKAVEQVRQRMRRRYDGTARQLKFQQKEKYWVWKNPNH